MELVQDQLILLYPNSKEDKEKGDVVVTSQWMAVQEEIDNIYLCAKQDGHLFILHVPYDGDMIFVPTKDGEPILAKKTMFGKYKFPKAKVQR